MTDEPSQGAREVRGYLVRLVILIAIGALLMAAVAIFAWLRYGQHLQDTVQPAPMPSAGPAPAR